MKPLVFATCSKGVLEAKLQEHEELQKEIEKTSSTIADVLNLRVLVLSDCASCKTAVNTESITVAIEALEKRWKNVRGLSADMKCRILTDWTRLEDFLRLGQEQQQWLESQDQILKDMASKRGQMSQDEIQDLISKVEQLESELEAKSDLLRNADELGLEVMKITRSDKLPAVQEMIDKYQLLWEDIVAQITVLKTECQDEIQKKELEERTVDEVDESVQVETLRSEQDSAVQVDTLPPLTKLTSRDAYLYELETAIQECIANLNSLEDALHLPTPPQGSRSQGSTSQMPKLMATCQSSVEQIGHLSAMLISESHVSEECARASEVRELTARYDHLLSRARAREQHIQESDESARLTCPLCSRRNWQQLDTDLWRLEQWLQFAEGTQGSQTAPPTNIEQLEDTIQDHREFLLYLESHKNIVVSLNIVGTHLTDHTEDTERAEQLRTRLVTTNGRWDAVCRAAAAWQTKLQTALMENDEFHQIIEELVTWLEKTENVIRQAEPVDLTDELEVIEAKYNKFWELRSNLERCEPRVMSLQEAADQLHRKSEGPEGASTTWSRLTELRLKLQSLRHLTGVYILKLGAVLGKDTSELGMSMASVATSGRSTAAASLMSLSQEFLDQAALVQFEGLVRSENQHKNDSSGSEPDDVDTTVLARGRRFLGRVLQASLPVQALMLLLLGVSALIPTWEEDYSCTLSNNFLEPILHYPNGPPPI